MKLDPSTAEYSSPPARNRRYRIPTDSGAADRKLRPIGRLEARSRSGPFFRVAIPIERPAQSPPERQDSGARVRNAPTVQVGPVAQALRVLFLRPNGALRRDRTECPIAAAHEGPRAAQNHAAGSGQPEQQNRRSVRLDDQQHREACDLWCLRLGRGLGRSLRKTPLDGRRRDRCCSTA